MLWCHKAICVKVIFVVYDNAFSLIHDFTKNNIVYNTDFMRLIKYKGKKRISESRQYFYIFMYSNEQPQNNIVSWWNCRMLFKHILLFPFSHNNIITWARERGRKYGRDAMLKEVGIEQKCLWSLDSIIPAAVYIYFLKRGIEGMALFLLLYGVELRTYAVH